MTMLAVIMHSPDFAEVCFLIAVILFAIEVVLIIAKPVGYTLGGLMIAAGLLAVALGFLAL
jgi:hypothetical protein